MNGAGITIRTAAAAVVLGWGASAGGAGMEWVLTKRDDARAADGTVEVRGVQAGPFDPALWRANALHWVAHAPTPMLRGNNIYAPTIVHETNGWQIFYGGWDLGFNGNDHIYAVRTPDFRSFQDRRMVIANGRFRHACNCSAVKLPDNTYYMLTTCKLAVLNKPCAFRSPDAKTWNGAAPYAATYNDLIAVKGDKGFKKADINGINVILYEDGVYRLYYGDFKRGHDVHRASSKDGKTYRYEGVSFHDPAHYWIFVNDVKKFVVGKTPWYLMALHQNNDRLWFSMARGDGLSFGKKKLLVKNRGNFDRYIVAIGLVCDDTTVYGFLYGASATRSLNTNKIFARWLQKRVAFVAGDKVLASCRSARGPDRAIMKVPAKGLTGQFRVFSEDGKTLLHAGSKVTLKPGEVWELLPAKPSAR